MRNFQFGVEIETVGLSQVELARAVQGALTGSADVRSTYGRDGTEAIDSQGRIWRVVHDASLSRVHRTQCGELVTPILGYEDLELLHRVISVVQARGARADDTTGIHVHVGAQSFDANSLARLVKIVHKQERLLEHALGISQHRLAQYCKPIELDFLSRLEANRPKTLSALKTVWYGSDYHQVSRYDQTRYHGLNLNSFYYRGTIEFRYFNGSVDADKVKAYVHLVLALAAKALEAKAASSKRREFNPATAKYDWRVFLLSLGLIGDEFKTTRRHLTAHLAGSAAWKGERRDRRKPPAADGEPLGTESTQLHEA